MKRLASRKSVRSVKKSAGGSREAVVVRPCHGIAEFEACVAVERAVWRSADLDVVPLPLFVVAAETGGQVLGAFVGRELIGFTLAFAGWRDRRPLLHSHMTAVLEAYRDQGIGRRLKLLQRDDALAREITVIEWTFDPLANMNAHFNLMCLGAVTRRYLPNVYGITSSPLHASLPTDRLLAEWHLQSSRVQRILAGKRPRPSFLKRSVHVAVPAKMEALKQSNPAAAIRLQSRIRAQFTRWFDKGYAATALASGRAGIDYVLEPWGPE